MHAVMMHARLLRLLFSAVATIRAKLRSGRNRVTPGVKQLHGVPWRNVQPVIVRDGDRRKPDVWAPLARFGQRRGKDAKRRQSSTRQRCPQHTPAHRGMRRQLLQKLTVVRVRTDITAKIALATHGCPLPRLRETSGRADKGTVVTVADHILAHRQQAGKVENTTIIRANDRQISFPIHAKWLWTPIGARRLAAMGDEDRRELRPFWK